MTTMRLLLLLCFFYTPSFAFHPPTHPSTATRLMAASAIDISNPSPEEAAEMGIREWPSQSRGVGRWSEACQDDQTLVRYILEGRGSLELDGGTYALQPGTLIEVTGDTTLEWEATSPMIVLTPGFEQVGAFVGVLAFLAAMGAGLILAS